MIYSNQKNVQSFSLGWQGWVLELLELRTPADPKSLKKNVLNRTFTEHVCMCISRQCKSLRL